MNVRVLLSIAVTKVRQEGPVAAFAKVVRYLRTGKGDKSFDTRFGVDTGGPVPIWRLKIGSENAKYGVLYQPTPEEDLKSAVLFLGIDPKRFTFVDLGCGKGRTLVIASQLGFSKIIGVEFAPELGEVARSNLAKLAIRNASVVDRDAARFSIPDGDIVVYMFNPFGKEVMDPVVNNLRRHSTGDIYVIYNEPKCADSLDTSGFLLTMGNVPGRPSIRLWKAMRQG